jgi:primosomal protein N' (replication factor Y)
LTDNSPQSYPQAPLNNFTPVWRIAVPAPLEKLFDYLPAVGAGNASAGCRVRVPFGRGSRIGVIVDTAATSTFDPNRLRRVSEVLDSTPVLSEESLALLLWCASYYHHPPGEVICGALPGLLRRGAPAQALAPPRWRLTEAGRSATPEARASRQTALLTALRQAADGRDAEQLDTELGTDSWRHTARALEKRGWVERLVAKMPVPGGEAASGELCHAQGPALHDQQAAAVEAILSAEGFEAFLLDGITGSGKTEVYFAAMAAALRSGRQVLVLVPEIGLTPQLVARLEARFRCPLAILHSGLSDGERLAAWRRAASGAAPIVVGTRSAVFAPMPALGLIIVDEEHDASYKQQESLRYHARDVAVMRARRLNIPVVLGSATPSLESLHNCMRERYRRLVLSHRAGAAAMPRMRLVDLRADRPRGGLSGQLATAIEAHLANDAQVLIFLNRRGYAPTLLCESCGWVAACQRCDAHLVLHRTRNLLRCHHCDAQQPLPALCPQCAVEGLAPVGLGTERIEESLRERFPGTRVLRIDRDSTRRRGSLEAMMENIRDGQRQILLGTQMLAKGHHLPNVTLVGVLDADQGLFGVDYRAGERMGQLIVQVAGRAGRAERPGEVLIQTRCPDHPLLGALIAGNYHAFARTLLHERSQSGMPPFRSMAMVRAESVHRDAPVNLLDAVRELAGSMSGDEVELLGPAPAPMERRAGRFRAQMLLLADRRDRLHALLATLTPRMDALAATHRARWSLDVDPVDES